MFSWVKTRASATLRGTLVDIFVSAEAGGIMRRLHQAEAIADAGLAGDRYTAGRGHWRLTDACQVTLLTEEDLRKAEGRSDLSFSEGEHRRNLVVRDIPLDAFRGRAVRIGDVHLVFQRLRPPCGYLERLVGPGASKALGKGAGICLRIIDGGMLRVGDEVVVADLKGEAP